MREFFQGWRRKTGLVSRYGQYINSSIGQKIQQLPAFEVGALFHLTRTSTSKEVARCLQSMTRGHQWYESRFVLECA